MKRILVCLFLMVGVSIANAKPINYNAYDGGWLPSGTQAIMGYVGHNGGNQYVKDGDKIHNVDYIANIGVLRYSGWFTAGIPFQTHVVVPFGRVKLEFPGVASNTGAGFMDPEFDIAVMPYKWNGGTFGVGVALTAPLGDYYYKNPINTGENRWMIRGMTMVGQNLGRWHIDGWLFYEFYTDNDRYTANKLTLEKENAISSEIHVSYVIAPASRTAISLSAGGMWGAKEKVNGNTTKTAMDDYAAKAGFSTFITESVTLNYTLTYDLQVRNGPKGYQNMLRIAKFF